MKVTVRAMTDQAATLLVEDTEPSFVNALRRTLMADVPKMAIEEVEFHLGPIRGEDGREYESVTPLFDEIIAHRLSLIPIPTDLDVLEPRATCSTCGGEGCPTCTIMFSLNKRGPGTAFSRDLQPVGDTKLAPPDPDIPIVKLGDGQAMLVYATAILGTGQDHAKWQAAQGAAYKFYPILEFDPKDETLTQEVAAVCPVNILEANGEFKVTAIEKCTLCRLCEEASEGHIQVSGDPTRFLFRFETDGALTAEQALNAALDILQHKFEDLAAGVEGLT
ncbi:MAG: DNA-directed RNA polymerase subunit D [Thermoplasmata archaeon]